MQSSSQLLILCQGIHIYTHTPLLIELLLYGWIFVMLLLKLSAAFGFTTQESIAFGGFLL